MNATYMPLIPKGKSDYLLREIMRHQLLLQKSWNQ
jgi:hypothetical protein